MAVGPEIELTRLIAVLRGIGWEVIATQTNPQDLTVTIRRPLPVQAVQEARRPPAAAPGR